MPSISVFASLRHLLFQIRCGLLKGSTLSLASKKKSTRIVVSSAIDQFRFVCVCVYVCVLVCVFLCQEAEAFELATQKTVAHGTERHHQYNRGTLSQSLSVSAHWLAVWNNNSTDWERLCARDTVLASLFHQLILPDKISYNQLMLAGNICSTSIGWQA